MTTWADHINALDSSDITVNVGTLTNTGGTATLGGILGDVANSSVATRLTNIVNQAYRTCAVKTVSSIATANLFTVSNGPIRLLSIQGHVTTGIEAKANNTKLVHTATGASAVDLCAVLNVTGAAQYSNLNITGTLANALVNTANGVNVAQAGYLVLNPGVISLNCADTSTGAISWYVLYEPMVSGAVVAPA